MRGGTNVTLSGGGLFGLGSHVPCPFGATLIDAHRCGGELADGGCLWCVAPANGSSAAATGQMELSLTLNDAAAWFASKQQTTRVPTLLC